MFLSIVSSSLADDAVQVGCFTIQRLPDNGATAPPADFSKYGLR